jgi:hypothetical protein
VALQYDRSYPFVAHGLSGLGVTDAGSSRICRLHSTGFPEQKQSYGANRAWMILCAMRAERVRLLRLIPKALKKVPRATLRSLESAQIIVRRD